ncbi:Uncharacterized protein GBIM_00156 [Gryllus bimaculatus]|nr:Uncharacterized protein GBIM_00156 [Gryllus bimaculatus]
MYSYLDEEKRGTILMQENAMGSEGSRTSLYLSPKCHAMSCMLLSLRRFAIADGRVTYQNRFLQSQTFRRNAAARRIVVTEFGTRAVPDPCQSIFQR